MCINGRAQWDTWLMVNTHCFPWQRSRADHQRERCWGCLDRRGWDASCNTQHHHINTALVISLMHITATSDGSIPYIKNTRARAPCMWSNNAFASSFLPLAVCPQTLILILLSDDGESGGVFTDRDFPVGWLPHHLNEVKWMRRVSTFGECWFWLINWRHQGALLVWNWRVLLSYSNLERLPALAFPLKYLGHVTKLC